MPTSLATINIYYQNSHQLVLGSKVPFNFIEFLRNQLLKTDRILNGVVFAQDFRN
jgi:hypothetical protein